MTEPVIPVDLPDLRLLGVHQSVILVADDEALIRNLVTLLLQHDGYFVLSAADGHEGLELSRKYPGVIDLLITDVEMPRMNGTDLCGHLMEERPGIKVLVMSGADMSEIVSQNANMPFLPKPFDGETLKAKVRAILAAPVQQNVRPENSSVMDVRIQAESSECGITNEDLALRAQMATAGLFVNSSNGTTTDVSGWRWESCAIGMKLRTRFKAPFYAPWSISTSSATAPSFQVGCRRSSSTSAV